MRFIMKFKCAMPNVFGSMLALTLFSWCAQFAFCLLPPPLTYSYSMHGGKAISTNLPCTIVVASIRVHHETIHRIWIYGYVCIRMYWTCQCGMNIIKRREFASCWISNFFLLIFQFFQFFTWKYHKKRLGRVHRAVNLLFISRFNDNNNERNAKNANKRKCKTLAGTSTVLLSTLCRVQTTI